MFKKEFHLAALEKQSEEVLSKDGEKVKVSYPSGEWEGVPAFWWDGAIATCLNLFTDISDAKKKGIRVSYVVGKYLRLYVSILLILCLPILLIVGFIYLGLKYNW